MLSYDYLTEMPLNVKIKNISYRKPMNLRALS